jgi:TonB family protein
LNRFREENDQPDFDSLIQKAVGDPLDEGAEEGSKIGTDISGRLQAEYTDVLGEKIKSVYELPTTISDEERVRLVGYLYLRVGAEGQLLEAKVDQDSGNVAFDNAILAAARKAAPFPPPPIPLRPFFASGFVFHFRP